LGSIGIIKVCINDLQKCNAMAREIVRLKNIINEHVIGSRMDLQYKVLKYMKYTKYYCQYYSGQYRFKLRNGIRSRLIWSFIIFNTYY